MGSDSAVLGSEAEGDSDMELLQRLHLPIKPLFPTGAETVSPAQTCAQVFHSQFPQPGDSVIQPVILKVEPLADAKVGREFREMFQRPFRRAVLLQKTHVEMAVVRRALGFAVACRCRPCLR